MPNRWRARATEADPEILDFLSKIPAGWRFAPTDEELVFLYLKPKIELQPLPMHMIMDVNIYNHHPETLSAEYEKFNDGEWYFFTPRDKKYPKTYRPNRKAIGGFWKASGKYAGVYLDGREIGKKRLMVFYNGNHPNSKKTDWLMKEYCCTVATPPPRQETDQENDMQVRVLIKKM
ncbi:PREDICTED: NAC transcription factor 25-like [Tarenaya hassleriana]|uniref:NAC transcription factor 25-like n=1 Tax=Tarenaya hassleriana TaxID=28532 RepID=UPI00053C7CDF|nr:PREDICTED: NAC transcription factor 25-like [Tarenaya hassleriana]